MLIFRILIPTPSYFGRVITLLGSLTYLHAGKNGIMYGARSFYIIIHGLIFIIAFVICYNGQVANANSSLIESFTNREVKIHSNTSSRIQRTNKQKW